MSHRLLIDRPLRSSVLFLLVAAAACSESRREPNPPNDNRPPTNGGSCGNGALNGVEPCDGTAVRGGRDCASLGLGMGSISCTSACQLDLSTCSFRDYCTANDLYSNGQCDNCELLGGVADPECATACAADGLCGDRFDALTGQWTCRRRGMNDPDCGTCGNQIIEGNELCDGMTQRPETSRCRDWGFEDGTLGCANCIPVFTGCRAARCGDGMIEGPERCEGQNLGSETCESLGFAGGMLTCTATCGYALAGCVAPGCGNGIIEGPEEQCEGQNLAGASCTSLGFLQGTLSCDGSCRFDTSACIARGCGNGIIEAPNEQCEGQDLGGATCRSEGFLSGNLACSATCRLDTSGCAGRPCGDGVARGLESCDGSDFASSNDCNRYGLGFQTMGCTPDCRLDFADCVSANDFCAVNNYYGDGVCDACQFYGGNLDPDCSNACGSDGTCVSYYEPPLGDYTCRAELGANDPDCGCGNGQIAPTIAGGLIPELCDGNTFATGAGACTDWRYSGGTLRCQASCLPDFTMCTP